MAQKEKEYLVAFKLYIEHYDPRYRYPKWIKAGSKKEAVTKYEAMIKPDTTLGACIIIDEREIPVKQDETKPEHPKDINLLEKFFNVYHKGNLKLLSMMIAQLDNLIDPTKPNHAPRPFIVDMDKINEQLCSTSKLASMLSSGIDHDMLPYNGSIYTDDFFEHVNDYMNTRYKNDLYDDYTLMRIRGDLQCMYNDYNRRGILPWETKKIEDAVCGTSEVMRVSEFPAVVNRDNPNEDKTLVIKITKQRTDDEDKTPDMGEAEHDKETGLRGYTGDLSHYSGLTKEDDSMKESIVKGDRTTNNKEPIEMITYVPQFDLIRADISINFPYILEIDNATTGVPEKHVIVITNILENCIYCNQWDNLNDDPHSGIVLSPFDFHERNAKLYKITGEDLK